MVLRGKPKESCLETPSGDPDDPSRRGEAADQPWGPGAVLSGSPSAQSGVPAGPGVGVPPGSC